MTGLLQVQGAAIVDGSGEPVRLKGTNIGGWLNMENFITGYSANESMMRAAVRGCSATTPTSASSIGC